MGIKTNFFAKIYFYVHNAFSICFIFFSFELTEIT